MSAPRFFFGSYQNKSNRPVWGVFVCGSHRPPSWSSFLRPRLLNDRAARYLLAACAPVHPLFPTGIRSRVRMGVFALGLAQDLPGRGTVCSHGRDGDSIPVRTAHLGNSLFFAMPPLILPDPGVPPDTPYYPQPPPDEDPALTQADVTQSPTTVSPPLTNQDTQFNSAGSEPAREPCEMPTASSSDFHLYESPGPPPSDNDDHPPLIALKNGWAYSVLRYWVQGKIVHFITSQGDQMQVPVTQVERIYPSSRQSHVSNPQSPPAK